MEYQKAIIHPVVILEIVKEFHGGNAKTKDKLGSIMGYYKKKNIFCTSAFNIPFEKKQNKVWFLDQIYMEKMVSMNRKINSKENIVGWFSLKKVLILLIGIPMTYFLATLIIRFCSIFGPAGMSTDWC